LNIVTTHGVAPGALADGYLSEPGEQQLPSNLVSFSDVDYFALGHIHLCDQVANRAWYAGSTERFGWGDEQATPGYRLVEFSTPGAAAVVTHRPIATRPMIRLKPEDATGRSTRELADAILHQASKLEDCSAMARVTLIGAERIVRREIQTILRRESPPLVWSLDLSPERQAFVANGAMQYTDEGAMDLHFAVCRVRSGPALHLPIRGLRNCASGTG
jgi:DNA repair exonuclease SbcCD nuclease subunit